MDIETLRSFLTVARLGNITHAADELHVTQPTLSRRISGLEHELGAALIKREHRSVSLTPAGEALLPEARRIVEHADALPALVASAQEGRRAAATTKDPVAGTLHLAHQTGIDESAMIAIGQLVRTRHPDVDITVSHAYPTALRAGAGSGHYDAVFFLRPHLRHKSPLTTYVLGKSDLMLAVPAEHPFAQRESVDVTDLQDEKVVMLERKVSPEIVDFINSKFIEAGFSLNAVRYVHDFDNGIVQVAAGNGVSFCHEMMPGLDLLESRGVRLVRITGADVTFDYVMRLSNSLSGPLRRVLVAAARSAVNEKLPQV